MKPSQPALILCNFVQSSQVLFTKLISTSVTQNYELKILDINFHLKDNFDEKIIIVFEEPNSGKGYKGLDGIDKNQIE